MRKVIVLPMKYHQIRTVYTDSFSVLFNRLCDEFGFDFIFADSLKGIAADLYLIQAGVHGKDLIKESTDLPANVKVILYLDGLHALSRTDNLAIPAFKRADYLLSCGAGDGFRKKWPEFLNKAEVSPTFFAPHERYVGLEFNDHPLLRCLLCGNTSKWYYLRHIIASTVLMDDNKARSIDIMRHPRWGTPRGESSKIIEGVMGDAYARVLNKYLCSVVGLAKSRAPLAKYYEIAAAGSLLLAEDSADVREAGFVAGKNYVSVNRDNVFDKINQCLDNPEAYRNIRYEGMKFVRENHSVENRVKRIGEILEIL